MGHSTGPAGPVRAGWPGWSEPVSKPKGCSAMAQKGFLSEPSKGPFPSPEKASARVQKGLLSGPEKAIVHAQKGPLSKPNKKPLSELMQNLGPGQGKTYVRAQKGPRSGTREGRCPGPKTTFVRTLKRRLSGPRNGILSNKHPDPELSNIRNPEGFTKSFAFHNPLAKVWLQPPHALDAPARQSPDVACPKPWKLAGAYRSDFASANMWCSHLGAPVRPERNRWPTWRFWQSLNMNFSFARRTLRGQNLMNHIMLWKDVRTAESEQEAGGGSPVGAGGGRCMPWSHVRWV